MPIVPTMPWQKAAPMAAAIPFVTPVPNAPKPPELPTVTNYAFDLVRSANRTELVTPTVPNSGHQGGQQKDSAKAKTRAVKQMDTGTTGKASARYKRVRKLVEDRKVKPSINAIAKLPDEHISKDVATDYMNAMERDGIVKKHGKGWVLV